MCHTPGGMNFDGRACVVQRIRTYVRDGVYITLRHYVGAVFLGGILY